MTDYRRMDSLRILFEGRDDHEAGNWEGRNSHVATRGGFIIGSDVTCAACIIDEQHVEDQPFRPVQDVGHGCGRLTLHAMHAVEGAGGVLDWCLVEGGYLPCREAVFCE